LVRLEVAERDVELQEPARGTFEPDRDDDAPRDGAEHGLGELHRAPARRVHRPARAPLLAGEPPLDERGPRMLLAPSSGALREEGAHPPARSAEATGSGASC